MKIMREHHYTLPNGETTEDEDIYEESWEKLIDAIEHYLDMEVQERHGNIFTVAIQTIYQTTETLKLPVVFAEHLIQTVQSSNRSIVFENPRLNKDRE